MTNDFQLAVKNLINQHYKRIIYVNLDEDRYADIEIQNDTIFLSKNPEKCGKISDWFLTFADNPLCFERDRRRIREYGNIDYIKRLCKESTNNHISFQYQRKYNLDDENYSVVDMELIPSVDFNSNSTMFLFIRDITEEELKSQNEIREALTIAENICQQNESLIADMQKTQRLIHQTLNSSLWQMGFDEDGTLQSINWSNEFRHMMGYTDELDFPNILESWTERIHDEDRDFVLKEYFDTINDYTGQKTFEAEYRFKLKNGNWHWFRSSGRLSRRSDGTPESYAGLCIDITEKKLNEDRFAKLEHEAAIDKLTGLYNRRAFDQAIEQMNTMATTVGYSIIALDVNGLKTLNDNIGHYAGDNLLKASANCINTFFGNSSHCYRTGGDEFVILTEEPIDDVEEYKAAFKECVAAYSDDHIDHITISIGVIRIKDYPFVSISEMLKLADQKMYQDKEEYYRTTGLTRRK